MRNNLPPQENPMSDGTPPERQLYSIGFLSQMLHRPPQWVQNLAVLAEVEPHQVINGVPHFRGDDVQKMAATLESLRDKVETIEAAGNN